MFCLHLWPSRRNRNLRKLLNWANAFTNPEISIKDIDYHAAKRLYEDLHAEGFKPRLNWSGSERIAVFKSAPTPHALVATWLCLNSGLINERLKAVAPCGRPSVCPKGATMVQLGDVGNRNPTDRTLFKNGNPRSYYQPDGSLYLQYRRSKGGKNQGSNDKGSEMFNIGPTPRVVLEISCSQSEQKVLEKACEYLHNSEGIDIHAVIICDMSYVEDYRNFRAMISVWTRLPKGDSGHPVEPCRLEDPGDHKPVPTSGNENEANSFASPSQNTETPLNKSVYFHPRDEGKEYPIWNRSGWKCIMDENSPSERDKELVFDFYDFVRLCDYNAPTCLPLEQREIKLELKWLSEQLEAELPVLRGELQIQQPLHLPNRTYPPYSHLSRPVRRMIKAAEMLEYEKSKS